jgi:hypothetical protein
MDFGLPRKCNDNAIGWTYLGCVLVCGQCRSAHGSPLSRITTPTFGALQLIDFGLISGDDMALHDNAHFQNHLACVYCDIFGVPYFSRARLTQESGNREKEDFTGCDLQRFAACDLTSDIGHCPYSGFQPG